MVSEVINGCRTNENELKHGCSKQNFLIIERQFGHGAGNEGSSKGGQLLDGGEKHGQQMGLGPIGSRVKLLPKSYRIVTLCIEIDQIFNCSNLYACA